MTDSVDSIIIPKPKTDLISDAFAKAQGKFRQPELNRKAEIKKEGKLLYTTLYADLNQCIECIRQSLSENNLSFTQTIENLNNQWLLILTLRHGSGQFLESFMPLDLRGSPQVVGGQLTYLKRYQISAFFGLAADFDDDGNAGSNNGNTYDHKPDPKPAKPKPKPQAKPETAPEAKPEASEGDPADLVMSYGSVKGKKIREIPEATLKQIRDWTHGELKKGQPALGGNLYEAYYRTITAIDSFLESVGVKP